MERVEKRVSATANMLNDMKAVKMLGLGDMLSKEILYLRKLDARLRKGLQITCLFYTDR
jgi:ATP-binding cassette subfamily C (CFTR/MRP) protein 1